MRHSLALTAAGGLLAGICLVTSSPAAARSVSVPDPPGDVMVASQEWSDCEYDGECEPEPTEPVRSDTPDADVVSSWFKHGARRISATSTYRELERPAEDEFLEWLLVTRGGNGQRRVLQVSADSERPGGVARMSRLSSGAPVCRGHITKRVDYAANTVSVSFPRWCAGRPQRIKLGGFTTRYRWEGQGDSTSFESAYDNPFADGGMPPMDWSDLGWTPWLRRG